MPETTLVSSPFGVLAVLCAVAAFWFLVQQVTAWKLFDYVPPLLFIYATPVILNNTGVLPASSPVYSGLSAFVLPAFIVLMLIKVNVPAAVRIMGKGVLVMLMGTLGVVVGAVVSYAIVHRWLSEDAWTGFGALAGSWIGGTANMAATAEILKTSPELFGLAVLADNVIYIIWLPILLGSKNIADKFNAWVKVPEDRLALMDAAAEIHATEERRPEMRDYIYLIAVAVAVTWIGTGLASSIHSSLIEEPDHTSIQGASDHAPPDNELNSASSEPGLDHASPEEAPDQVSAEKPRNRIEDVFSETTIKILLITTIALLLSVTRVSTLPNATNLGTALIYVFVAGMGARASLAGFAQAPAFLLGALIWIFIHGAFCVLAAKIFRVDVHSTAIASAANIGAAASAPIVAAFHRPSLVPVSVLMALLGYAIGNYVAPLTGRLAQFVVGQ